MTGCILLLIRIHSLISTVDDDYNNDEFNDQRIRESLNLRNEMQPLENYSARAVLRCVQTCVGHETPAENNWMRKLSITTVLNVRLRQQQCAVYFVYSPSASPRVMSSPYLIAFRFYIAPVSRRDSNAHTRPTIVESVNRFRF